MVNIFLSVQLSKLTDMPWKEMKILPSDPAGGHACLPLCTLNAGRFEEVCPPLLCNSEHAGGNSPLW